MNCDCPVCKIITQDSMQMAGQQSVGRVINLECHRPPKNPICARCLMLEKGIREYLKGYTSRRVREEGEALVELSRLIGYKDIVD